MRPKKLSHFSEDALVMVNYLIIFSLYLEGLLEMDGILLLVVRYIEYVIQIDNHLRHASHDVTHLPLKHLSSVGET